jgi:2-iminobutanoate/2-iminopropanoate deaminase
MESEKWLKIRKIRFILKTRIAMNGCLKKEVVTTEKARAIGPYSLGIKVGNFVYCSGQAGVDQSTGKMVQGGIEAETRQTLINLGNILEAAGSGLDRVVKTTVFLQDIKEFARMNAVYAEFFKCEPPARSTVQVAALPLGAVVEIEAIALLKNQDDTDSNCSE